MTQIAPARSQFADVKPFPTTTPPPMGHNAPPLDEMIVIELNEAIDGRPDFRARIAEIIAKADTLPECKNDDDAGRLGDFIRIAKAAATFIDGERVRIKAPYLAATRALDGAANGQTASLTEAAGKAKKRLDTFIAQQAELARLERRRIEQEQAELRCQAEAREAEARRVAEVERQRLQAIADAEAAKERAQLQAIEDEQATREAREAKAVEVVAEVVAVEPEPVAFYVEPAAPAAPFAPVFRGDLGSRVGVKTEWRSAIENVRQLPDAVLKHPNVVEALGKVVAGLVRGGTRQIKGARIWSEEVSSVR